MVTLAHLLLLICAISSQQLSNTVAVDPEIRREIAASIKKDLPTDIAHYAVIVPERIEAIPEELTLEVVQHSRSTTSWRFVRMRQGVDVFAIRSRSEHNQVPEVSIQRLTLDKKAFDRALIYARTAYFTRLENPRLPKVARFAPDLVGHCIQSTSESTTLMIRLTLLAQPEHPYLSLIDEETSRFRSCGNGIVSMNRPQVSLFVEALRGLIGGYEKFQPFTGTPAAEEILKLLREPRLSDDYQDDFRKAHYGAALSQLWRRESLPLLKELSREKSEGSCGASWSKKLASALHRIDAEPDAGPGLFLEPTVKKSISPPDIVPPRGSVGRVQGQLVVAPGVQVANREMWLVRRRDGCEEAERETLFDLLEDVEGVATTSWDGRFSFDRVAPGTWWVGVGRIPEYKSGIPELLPIARRIDVVRGLAPEWVWRGALVDGLTVLLIDGHHRARA